MAYKKSQARNTLQFDLNGILAKVKLAEKRSIDPNIKEYVLAASVFLAHATLENYISDVFSKFANGIHSLSLKGEDLPENLRAHLFLKNINKPKIYGAEIGIYSEKEAFAALSKALNGYAGKIIDNSKTIYEITGEDIYTCYKYPSESNLNKIFERIGISNIFNVLSARMNRNAVATLQSLGSLRTQLAHTGQIPGISPRDIKKRLSELEDFVSAVDRTIYKEMVSKYGQNAWYRHVA